jgi:hypothetical protein
LFSVWTNYSGLLAEPGSLTSNERSVAFEAASVRLSYCVIRHVSNGDVTFRLAQGAFAFLNAFLALAGRLDLFLQPAFNQLKNKYSGTERRDHRFL